MLPIEIWALVLSYLPLIDLLIISACSKMFYHLACDNQRFKIELKDSHSLVPFTDLFDRYYGKCLSFSCQLSHRMKKYFDEGLMFVVRKKTKNK